MKLRAPKPGEFHTLTYYGLFWCPDFWPYLPSGHKRIHEWLYWNDLYMTGDGTTEWDQDMTPHSFGFPNPHITVSSIYLPDPKIISFIYLGDAIGRFWPSGQGDELYHAVIKRSEIATLIGAGVNQVVDISSIVQHTSDPSRAYMVVSTRTPNSYSNPVGEDPNGRFSDEVFLLWSHDYGTTWNPVSVKSAGNTYVKITQDTYHCSHNGCSFDNGVMQYYSFDGIPELKFGLAPVPGKSEVWVVLPGTAWATASGVHGERIHYRPGARKLVWNGSDYSLANNLEVTREMLPTITINNWYEVDIVHPSCLGMHYYSHESSAEPYGEDANGRYVDRPYAYGGKRLDSIVCNSDQIIISAGIWCSDTLRVGEVSIFGWDLSEDRSYECHYVKLKTDGTAEIGLPFFGWQNGEAFEFKSWSFDDGDQNFEYEVLLGTMNTGYIVRDDLTGPSGVGWDDNLHPQYPNYGVSCAVNLLDGSTIVGNSSKSIFSDVVIPVGDGVVCTNMSEEDELYYIESGVVQKCTRNDPAGGYPWHTLKGAYLTNNMAYTQRDPISEIEIYGCQYPEGADTIGVEFLAGDRSAFDMDNWPTRHASDIPVNSLVATGYHVTPGASVGDTLYWDGSYWKPIGGSSTGSLFGGPGSLTAIVRFGRFGQYTFSAITTDELSAAIANIKTVNSWTLDDRLIVIEQLTLSNGDYDLSALGYWVEQITGIGEPNKTSVILVPSSEHFFISEGVQYYIHQHYKGLSRITGIMRSFNDGSFIYNEPAMSYFQEIPNYERLVVDNCILMWFRGIRTLPAEKSFIFIMNGSFLEIKNTSVYMQEPVAEAFCAYNFIGHIDAQNCIFHLGKQADPFYTESPVHPSILEIYPDQSIFTSIDLRHQNSFDYENLARFSNGEQAFSCNKFPESGVLYHEKNPMMISTPSNPSYISIGPYAGGYEFDLNITPDIYGYLRLEINFNRLAYHLQNTTCVIDPPVPTTIFIEIDNNGYIFTNIGQGVYQLAPGRGYLTVYFSSAVFDPGTCSAVLPGHLIVGWKNRIVYDGAVNSVVDSMTDVRLILDAHTTLNKVMPIYTAFANGGSMSWPGGVRFFKSEIPYQNLLNSQTGGLIAFEKIDGSDSTPAPVENTILSDADKSIIKIEMDSQTGNSGWIEIKIPELDEIPEIIALKEKQLFTQAYLAKVIAIFRNDCPYAIGVRGELYYIDSNSQESTHVIIEEEVLPLNGYYLSCEEIAPNILVPEPSYGNESDIFAVKLLMTDYNQGISTIGLSSSIYRIFFMIVTVFENAGRTDLRSCYIIDQNGFLIGPNLDHLVRFYASERFH